MSGWVARTLAPMGVGSLRGSVLTLMSAAIGTGSLLLPYMFRLMGIPAGLACLFFGAFCNAQSLRLIMTIAHVTGCESYPHGVACLLGPWAGAMLSNVLCFVLVLATGSHLKFLISILSAMLPEGITEGGARTLATLLVFPMCAVRDIGSLRHAAVLSPVALGYVALLVMGRGLSGGGGELVELGRAGGWSELPRAWSLVLNAVTCQHVAVPVFRQLHRARAQRVNKVVLRSTYMLTLMYAAIGVAGFLSCGATTPENILLAFPSADAAAMLGQVLVGSVLMVSIPLCVNALRAQVKDVLPPKLHKSNEGHAILTAVLLSLPTAISWLFPSVSSIVGIACGFGMVLYMFVVPAVCMCVLRWRPDWPAQALASGMLPKAGSGSLNDLLLSSPLSTPLLGPHDRGMVSPRAGSPSMGPEALEGVPELVLDEVELVEDGSRPSRSPPRWGASTPTRLGSNASMCSSNGCASPADWDMGAEWDVGEFAASLVSLAVGATLGLSAGVQSLAQLASA